MHGKDLHESTFAYDIVPIPSPMTYTDIVEYKIVRDTRAPLLGCFPFTSRLKSGETRTTGQNMNYQAFSNLQFGRLMKNYFHSIHIELRDMPVQKIPFVSVGVSGLVLMFRKVSDIYL